MTSKLSPVLVDRFGDLHQSSNLNTIPLFVCLDGIQDPMNLGSILRSSVFFNVNGIIRSNKSSAPLNPLGNRII